MDTKLRQYDFGSISGCAVVKGIKGMGYDATLDFLGKAELYGKGESENIGLSCFSYLFRRLGPPKGGNKRQYLARYILPTEDKDIYLAINLSTQVDFEVIADKKLAKEYLDWYFSPVIEWSESFSDWAAEKGEFIYDKAFAMLPKEKQDKAAKYLENDISLWESTLSDEDKSVLNSRRELGKPVHTKEDTEAFFTWKAERVNKLREEYAIENPFPIPSGYKKVAEWHNKIHSEANCEAAKRIYAAVNSLLGELIKPVLINGVFCNVFGAINALDDEDSIKEANERNWIHLGNGFIEYDLVDYRRWVDLCGIAREVGDGDIQKGFDKIFSRYKNARKLKKRN